MILTERGWFWWNDKVLEAKIIVPDFAVPGTLTIKDDGQAVLELDGYFENNRGPFSVLDRQDTAEGWSLPIQGVLKANPSHVLLMDVLSNGGHLSANGISHARYTAGTTIIGQHHFAPVNLPPQIKKISVSLEGFEDWLRIGGIKIDRTRQSLKVSYKPQKNLTYKIPAGILSIKYDLTGPLYQNESDDVHLKHRAFIELKPSTAMSVADAAQEFHLIEDFLLILSNFAYALKWPQVQLKGHITPCTVYHQSIRGTDQAPGMHRSFSNLLVLKESLGELYSNWKSAREKFGPGIYQYLSTRRGHPLYTENRFSNLIIGLEALERTLAGPRPRTPFNEKVDRILAQIIDPKDVKFITRLLPKDPRLGERLFTILSRAPLGIEKDRMITFCENCVNYRNEIAHYGGPRSGGRSKYSEFLTQLTKVSDALAVLYHAAIQTEIGMDTTAVAGWTRATIQSFTARWQLEQVGLVDPIKPEAMRMTPGARFVNKYIYALGTARKKPRRKAGRAIS